MPKTLVPLSRCSLRPPLGGHVATSLLFYPSPLLRTVFFVRLSSFSELDRALGNPEGGESPRLLGLFFSLILLPNGQ